MIRLTLCLTITFRYLPVPDGDLFTTKGAMLMPPISPYFRLEYERFFLKAGIRWPAFAKLGMDRPMRMADREQTRCRGETKEQSRALSQP
jgi:hypothetical protein